MVTNGLYNLLLSSLRGFNCHIICDAIDRCSIASRTGVITSRLLYRCVDIARSNGLNCYVAKSKDYSVKIVFYDL